MGRLDHVRIGDQAGIEDERIKVVLNRSEMLEVELEAGDALFFHW